MKRFILPLVLTLVLTLALILVACASSQVSTNSSLGTSQVASQPASPASNSGSASLTRSDGQGAVTVDVTPSNLSNPSDKLEFNVSLNTHSVNLAMNLATLATLTTDTGVTVQAASWDAPSGGHHVEGKLTFPATKDGKSILGGASKITLTIVNLDAPSRVFEWQLK